MRLSEYARRLGLSHRAAWEQYHRGEIDGAYQLKSGTIIVPDSFLVYRRRLDVIRLFMPALVVRPISPIYCLRLIELVPIVQLRVGLFLVL